MMMLILVMKILLLIMVMVTILKSTIKIMIVIKMKEALWVSASCFLCCASLGKKNTTNKLQDEELLYLKPSLN